MGHQSHLRDAALRHQGGSTAAGQAWSPVPASLVPVGERDVVPDTGRGSPVMADLTIRPASPGLV